MGDTTIAQDILEGVKELLAELGSTRILRVITKTEDPENSTNVLSVNTDVDNETYFYDYESKYINGTTVKEGDKQALIDLLTFGQDPKSIDCIIDGTEVWKVIKTFPTEIAGIGAVVVLQIRK